MQVTSNLPAIASSGASSRPQQRQTPPASSQLRHPILPTSSHPARSPAGRPPWLETPDRDLDVDLDPGPDLPTSLPARQTLSRRSRGATEPLETDSSGVIFPSVLPTCSPQLFSTTPRRSIPILRALSALCNQLPWPSCTCTASLCRPPPPPPPLQFEPRVPPPPPSIQLPLPKGYG